MKLGDICNILNGRNQKKVEDINGKYPIYGSGGIMGYANDYICKAGTTIIGRKGSINKPLYVDKDFWNVDTAFGLQPKECCNSRILYYLCKSIDFTRYDKGVTIPSLVKSDLLQIPVSVPPLSEQYRIVEELDQLSNIIEKKRQQLSELDNLAQSIFYDMFGDPIKASYTKMPLKELAENIGDGLHGTPNYSDDGDCYFINGNNLEDGKIVVSNSTKKVDKKEKDKYFIELNTKTILVSINGTLGKIAYYNNENVILGKSACYIKLKEGINKVYIYNILCSDYFKRYAQDNATGSTIRNVSLKSMRNLLIPIPPLEKQDDYMNKIEAIEKEKELIKQSIKETEELFNSRMDYYFG